MTIRNDLLGGTDWSDGNVLYSADLNDTLDATLGFLGEVRMFALSLTGAVTKASLQTAGWAICDGTTPSSQGITGATITSTPDLQEKFIRMSDDETSGTTGGSSSHTHSCVHDTNGCFGYNEGGSHISTSSNIPPFYELAFFIKVKI